MQTHWTSPVGLPPELASQIETTFAAFLEVASGLLTICLVVGSSLLLLFSLLYIGDRLHRRITKRKQGQPHDEGSPDD